MGDIQVTDIETVRAGRPMTVRPWPVLVLAAPAFIAIWSGWVGLGELTGFGVVHPLPGIADGFSINSAITLPVGVETYAAFAIRVWLSGRVPPIARRFAKWSAIGSLALGAGGQVAYHLLVAAGVTAAPWQITTLVSCLPVAVLGMGAALAHLLRAGEPPADLADVEAPEVDAFAMAQAAQVALAAALEPVGELSGTGQPVTVPGGTPRRRRAERKSPPSSAAEVAKILRRNPAATPAQIAAKVGISESTARRHRDAILPPTVGTPEVIIRPTGPEINNREPELVATPS
jgi:hypothetical protein